MIEPPEPASRPMEELSLQDLAAAEATLKYQAERIKIDRDAITGEVNKRLGEMATNAYEVAQKDSGTLSMTLPGGVTAKCDITKKVEYDSAALLKLAQTMPWDKVNRVFKIAFAVTETTYKGIAAADPELRMLIDDARTVKLAPVKITLSMEG